MPSSLLSRELGQGKRMYVAERGVCQARTASVGQAAPLRDAPRHHRGALTWLDLERAEHRYLLACSNDGTVALYDARRLDDARSKGQCCVASARIGGVNNAPPALVGGGVADNRPRSAPGMRSSGCVCALFYPVDNGMFVTASSDDHVRFWDTNAMQAVLDLPLFDKVYHLAVPHVHPWARGSAAAPHALTAATVADGSVALCDPVSGTTAHTLAGCHRAAVLCCAWSPVNPNHVASGGSDGVVAVWDIRRSASTLVELTAESESAHAAAARAAAAAKAAEEACEDEAAAWRELEQARADASGASAAAAAAPAPARPSKKRARPGTAARDDDHSVPRASFGGGLGDIRMPRPLPRASLVSPNGRSARAVGMPTTGGATATAAQRRQRLRRAAVGGGRAPDALPAPMPGLSDGRAFHGGGGTALRRVAAHDASVIGVHASACGETWLALAADGSLRSFDAITGRRRLTSFPPLAGSVASQQHRPCAWATDANAMALREECVYVPLGRRGLAQVPLAGGGPRAEFKAHFGAGVSCAALDAASATLYTGGLDRNIFRWRPLSDGLSASFADGASSALSSDSDGDGWSDDDAPP